MVGVFGSRNHRLLKRYGSLVAAAGALEEGLKALSDDALRAKTDELKKRYTETEDLDALLPEAFALVREAARRTLGMRHFDVQLIGGIALHQGKIAEMRTGEGKTLVATLTGWPPSTDSSGSPSASSRATSRPRKRGRPTRPTSPTARTTSSVSTIC